MTELFAGYVPEGAFDEMFAAPGTAREAAARLHATLSALSARSLEDRCAERDRSFQDRGVTFSLAGEERPFPLDLIPRIVTATEWAVVEAGVAQRVRALEAFLADVHGPGAVLDDGIVPRRLVTTSRHFHREAFGFAPAGGVRVHVAGIDLVRDPEGRFRVLEDNVRIPSGISYVVENRRAMASIFPELFASHRVRPVADYPARLLAALQAASPRATGAEPTVVVLTPGIHNAAYFEHSFLARQMGVELVEGRDLVCRRNVCYLRTISGEERVDVVYRRVDDVFLDPVQFRPDSLIGCPGLLNAARAGNVTIANAVGNGVADDKLTYTYVPDLIAYYLGERPILENVETYRLEDADVRAAVLSRLDEVVCKPVDGAGGHGLVMGPAASDEELAALAARIEAAPRDWIAQEIVPLSTAPTKVGRRLEPRHVDLRPFAVNEAGRIWVVPGGLTRVALPRGSLVVNSSQGGGSKDTWVLAEAALRAPVAGLAPAPLVAPDPDRARREAPVAALAALAVASTPPEPGPVVAEVSHQQERQQQQQADGAAAC